MNNINTVSVVTDEINKKHRVEISVDFTRSSNGVSALLLVEQAER